MTVETLQVGTLVNQPKKPEWGPGKVVKLDGQRAHVVWRDLPEREAKIMVTSVLQRAEEQTDPVLDNLPPLREEDGKLVLPRERITFEQAVDSFLARFPQGFYDPGFLRYERDYKVSAHEFYKQHLEGAKFRRLLDDDIGALAKELERCINKLNFLHMTESAALHDALQDHSSAKTFLTRLADLLEATEVTNQDFDSYADALARMPAERGGVMKWTIATIIPFIAQPERHMFLKPGVTKNAAESLGFELNYRPEPNWRTYTSLLRMAEIYSRKLAHLKPRDLIDVQSFFYVACGGYK